MREGYYQQFTLPSPWKQISGIRLNVQKLLSSYSEHLQNGATVTVLELAENAIKYGIPTSNMLSDGD